MSPLPPNITLTPASKDDIPAILEIGNLGMLKDTHTQLKSLIRGPDHDDGMLGFISSMVDHPRVNLIVAKKHSGDEDVIVGYIAWAHRNLDIPSPVQPTWGPTPPPPKTPNTTPLTVNDLEKITNESMNTWQEYLSPDNVKCRIIVMLSVHPSYQGQGIGKALMRWGTDKADEEGVYCWVQASMGSKGAYEAGGFKEVGRLELDLDMFAEGKECPEELSKEGNEGKWGVYFWPYMRRDPVGKAV